MINFLLAPFIAIGVMLGSLFAPTQEPTLGASEAIPTTIAFFETTLASAISSTATSFTLTSATDKDGTTLASSTYAFVIDEGSSNEEIVIADCTGTACTNVERGISVRTGNTEVAALKKSHRRGASVKMTDAPILVLMARALRGDDVTSFTPSGNGSLVTKSYVDALSFGGVVAATESDDGFIELATQTEMSSSTPLGSSGSSLVLQAKYATSSCQVVGRYVPITDPLTGRVDAGCLDTTYASSSLTIGSTPILDIGKNSWATTTGSSTGSFTVPTGISKIKIKVWGAGGGAPGASDTDVTPAGDQLRDPGSYGNYSEAIVSVTAGDIFNITVGSGGVGGTSNGVYGKQGNPTTIVDNAGSANFSMTVGDSGDNSGRLYSSASTITGTDKLSSFTVIGAGSAGGTYVVPNNSSDQTGGTGNPGVVVIEY